MALHGFVYSPDTKGRILTLLDALVNTSFRRLRGLISILGAVQRIQAAEE